MLYNIDQGQKQLELIWKHAFHHILAHKFKSTHSGYDLQPLRNTTVLVVSM